MKIRALTQPLPRSLCSQSLTMALTGSISGSGGRISGLLRLRQSPPAASIAVLATPRPAGSVSDGGNLICGRQLCPSLFQGINPSLLPMVAGKRKILRPIAAAASSSPAEGSDSAGEVPVPFTVKYQALITGSFFFMWYFLNVIFNILNKKIYNYFPYPYFVSVIHLFVGVVYCLVSWLVGLPKRAELHETQNNTLEHHLVKNSKSRSFRS